MAVTVKKLDDCYDFLTYVKYEGQLLGLFERPQGSWVNILELFPETEIIAKKGINRFFVCWTEDIIQDDDFPMVLFYDERKGKMGTAVYNLLRLKESLVLEIELNKMKHPIQ